VQRRAKWSGITTNEARNSCAGVEHAETRRLGEEQGIELEL
jgi:hypothetical protein